MFINYICKFIHPFNVLVNSVNTALNKILCSALKDK